MLVDRASRDEVSSRTNELSPSRVTIEVRGAQRSRARNEPEVIALNRRASIKVSSNREPLNLDGAFLV